MSEVKRTKSEVLQQRMENPTVGCCNRYADNMTCTCLNDALPDPPGSEPKIILKGNDCPSFPEKDSTPTIRDHEGSKYIRKIVGCTLMTDTAYSIDGKVGMPMIEVDVYEVIRAFGVTCPAQQHALKKLLAAGQRNKGDRQADLKGAIAAINRAIELDKTAHVFED